MDKYLNIVSFNIPFPANYGGVIDVFYRLKTLHDNGVRIILHCFEYQRPHSAELEDICEHVHYYKRETGIIPNLSLLPYNVVSRKSDLLIEQLLTNDYPILFESLHSCYYLSDPRLKGRLKIYRAGNIEHDYYYSLYKAESRFIDKSFFLIESCRLANFEKNIRHADIILAISSTDEAYFKKTYPQNKVVFIPAFHGNKQIASKAGQSDFMLYHANLSVAENEKAALYLIENVFSKLNHNCIIAGMNPSAKLRDAIEPFSNITIEANPTDERMAFLIQEAHIHVLVTFQDTGLKLKLLNSLFAGRHIVVNPMMLAGSGLDDLCHSADSDKEIRALCDKLMSVPFTETDIEERRNKLFPAYDDKCQAECLYKMIYGDE